MKKNNWWNTDWFDESSNDQLEQSTSWDHIDPTLQNEIKKSSTEDILPSSVGPKNAEGTSSSTKINVAELEENPTLSSNLYLNPPLAWNTSLSNEVSPEGKEQSYPNYPHEKSTFINSTSEKKDSIATRNKNEIQKNNLQRESFKPNSISSYNYLIDPLRLWEDIIPEQIKYTPKDFAQDNGSFPKEEEITHFGEGLKQYGKRWVNDMRYNIGSLLQFLGDEGETQEVLAKWGPYSESLYNRGVESLEKDLLAIDQWEKNISNRIKNLDSSDPFRIQKEQAYRQFLNNTEKYQILLNQLIPRMKEGLDFKTIQKEFSEYATLGGPGQQKVRKAQEINESFLPSETWGSLGEFSGAALQNTLPLLATMVHPMLGGIMGSLNTISMGAQVAAQAQMEMDQYEKENHVKLNPQVRRNYIATNVISEILTEALMQGLYLGRTAIPKRGTLPKKAIDQLMERVPDADLPTPIAAIFKNLLRKNSIQEYLKDIALETSSEMATSVLHDLSQGIYNEIDGIPALEEIASNAGASALSGALIGGITGAASQGVRSMRQHTQNKNRNLITVGTLDKRPVLVTRLMGDDLVEIQHPSRKSEIVPENTLENVHTMHYDAYRKSQTSDKIPSTPPKKETPIEFSLDFIDEIKVPDGKGNLRYLTPEEKAQKREETIQKIQEIFQFESPDDVKITSFEEINQPSPSKPKVSTEELETRRKYVNQRAKELGVEVDIYNSETDIPESVKKGLDPGSKYYGFFSPDEGRISIILDQGTDLSSLNRTLLHEAIGHKGMRMVLGNKADAFYDRIFSIMSPEDQQTYLLFNYGDPRLAAEEYLANVAGRDIQDASFWEKAKGEARHFLREKLGMEIPVTDQDYRHLLRKSRKILQEEDLPPYLMIRRIQEEENYRRRIENDQKASKQY